MGILDNMAQQANAQPQMQQTATLPQTEQTGNMMQMYQFLMQNSMQAIAETAEQRIHEKGPVDGTADLIATAMVSNLQAAQQNGKTIPTSHVTGRQRYCHAVITTNGRTGRAT